VNTEALRDERKPLLDLDDVELLESELAACFDAPPPPPLSIHPQEPTATVSSWTPSLAPRYVENHHAAPPAASEVTAAAATRTQAEERREREAQQAVRVSDFSNLYLPAPERATSSGQLYPALIPTAPSSEAAGAPAASQERLSTTMPPSAATLDADRATSGVATAAAALSAMIAAGERRGGAVARAAAGESSIDVVEELLSENERLRFIIEDMSDEESVRESDALVVPTRTAAAASSQSQRSGASSAPVSAMTQLLGYPGAAAEASRRDFELSNQANQQQQQQQQQTLRRGIFVHFKCENCPQWLKVPGHAQLVFCPTCSHTSQMTPSSTIHFPPNNEIPGAGRSTSGGGGSMGNTAAEEPQSGWLGYFKSILAS
ncbi:unnamed protein product, partial [Ascophyllum nodosum]